MLIGAVPPATISDWRYLGVSHLASLVTYFWYPMLDRMRCPVLVFDGAGLVPSSEGARPSSRAWKAGREHLPKPPVGEGSRTPSRAAPTDAARQRASNQPSKSWVQDLGGILSRFARRLVEGWCVAIPVRAV